MTGPGSHQDSLTTFFFFFCFRPLWPIEDPWSAIGAPHPKRPPKKCIRLLRGEGGCIPKCAQNPMNFQNGDASVFETSARRRREVYARGQPESAAESPGPALPDKVLIPCRGHQLGIGFAGKQINNVDLKTWHAACLTVTKVLLSFSNPSQIQE